MEEPQLKQKEAPIYDKIKQFTRKRSARFHVPGHKGFLLEQDDIFQSIYPYDLTELAGLDDLSDPHGIIADAEDLAAQLFKADETFFLVGGSTAGNLAAVLSSCKPGDVLIVERNVHKSVIHALILAQAKAVFVSPEVDPNTGIAKSLSYSAVKKALATYPEAKAVMLTRPNYYGMAQPIESIVELVHCCGKLLIVDEAHGAHLGFHPNIPTSALSAGADIVVQSTHKMLTSLTMTGMLHIQGERVDSDKIKQRLSQIQSSSPSYILMASIDLARKQLALSGYQLIDRFIHKIHHWIHNVHKLTCFELIGATHNNSYTQDPFKLLIRDRSGTLTGFHLQDALRKYDCWAEMADPAYCLLAFSMQTSAKDLEILTQALYNIQKEYHLHQVVEDIFSNDHQWIEAGQAAWDISQPVDFSEQAQEKCIQSMPLIEAVGFRAAEMVIPYPPGIPLLYPGETITDQSIELILRWKQAGARFQLQNNQTIEEVEVYQSS